MENIKLLIQRTIKECEELEDNLKSKIKDNDNPDDYQDLYFLQGRLSAFRHVMDLMLLNK